MTHAPLPSLVCPSFGAKRTVCGHFKARAQKSRPRFGTLGRTFHLIQVQVAGAVRTQPGSSHSAKTRPSSRPRRTSSSIYRRRRSPRIGPWHR
jgi:hypothetical protein